MANLDPNRLQNLHRYWQAANYLTIGQIYLQENPLLPSRCGRSTLSRGCWAIGGPRPASALSTCISTA